MAAPLYSTDSGQLYHAGNILISCVGLPARGKTHIARSLLRYLRWLGVKTEVFSLGDYRRKRLGSAASLPADYFHPNDRSEESERLRNQMKTEMSDIIMSYFKKEGGQVAIYDANNTTIQERQYLRDICAQNKINIMFIETICSDAIVEKNIRAVKLASPDYKGWDPEDAVKDYWSRIRNQEVSYQAIQNPSFPYVKVIDIGERIIVNNIQGYLQSRTVFFLMNIHNRYRRIYFARSGASYAEHSYKADAGLSEVGESYAIALREFLLAKREKDRQNPEEREKQRRLCVWTSSRRRCLGTAKPFLELGYKVIERGSMTEINPGIVDGLSRQEIKQLYPEEYERSIKEPYSHRFPRAESYHDLSVRLEPSIFELERDRSDLLIIGHGSVLRCLFAYLKGLAPKDIPKVLIERGDLIEVLPSSYGVTSKTYSFWRPPAGFEDTHIEPGTVPGTYGSPVQPNVGLSVLAAQHAQSLAQYSHKTQQQQGRTPSVPDTPLASAHNLPGASDSQSLRTPRLPHAVLADITDVPSPAPDSPRAHIADEVHRAHSPYINQANNAPDSGAQSPAGGAKSPPKYQGDAIGHIRQLSGKMKQAILDRDQMLEKDKFGNDSLDQGDSCEWGKARPAILSHLSEKYGHVDKKDHIPDKSQ